MDTRKRRGIVSTAMERPPRPARRRRRQAARRWFQLHLSTALLLMFAAGVLMTLNLQPRRSSHTLSQPANSGEPEKTFYVRIVSHGWPFWTDAQFTRVAADGSDFEGYTDFATSTALFKLVRAQLGIPEGPDPIRYINGGVGLAMLVVLALASECFIRRRKPAAHTVAPLLSPSLSAPMPENGHVAESSALPEIDRTKS